MAEKDSTTKPQEAAKAKLMKSTSEYAEKLDNIATTLITLADIGEDKREIGKTEITFANEMLYDIGLSIKTLTTAWRDTVGDFCKPEGGSHEPEGF